MASAGRQILDQLSKYKAQLHMARLNSLLSSEGRMRLEDEIRRSMEAYRIVAARDLAAEWAELRRGLAQADRQLTAALQNAHEDWDPIRLQGDIASAMQSAKRARTLLGIEKAYLKVMREGDRTARRAWQETVPSILLRRWPAERSARSLAKRMAADLPETLSTPEVEAAQRAQRVLARRAAEAYVATEVARAEYYPGAPIGADEFSRMLGDIELSRIGDVELLGLGRSLTLAAVDPVKVSRN